MIDSNMNYSSCHGVVFFFFKYIVALEVCSHLLIIGFIFLDEACICSCVHVCVCASVFRVFVYICARCWIVSLCSAMKTNHILNLISSLKLVFEFNLEPICLFIKSMPTRHFENFSHRYCCHFKVNLISFYWIHTVSCFSPISD